MQLEKSGKIYGFWLCSALGVKKEDILVNVAINESHKDRIKGILNFWASLLDLPVNSFGNTTFIHSPYKRKYVNRDSYQGMIRIKVRRSSWLRRRILGMIKVFNSAGVAQVVRASHS